MLTSTIRRLTLRSNTSSRHPFTIRVRMAVRRFESKAVPATFTVTGTGDSGVGTSTPGIGGSGDLRFCMQEAADATDFPGGDIINFGSGVTGAINLTGTLPTIDDALQINGPGASLISVNGKGKYRPLVVNVSSVSGSDVGINGLTITNGYSLYAGAGVLLQAGRLVISKCSLSNNLSADEGGAVHALGSATGTELVLSECTIAGNFASFGGGIAFNGDTLDVVDCVISGNDAVNSGGGLYASQGVERVTISRSRIVGNEGRTNGGGIYAVAVPDLLLEDCEIAENIMASNITGGAGAGLAFIGGSPVLRNCTVSGNIADGNAAGMFFSQGVGSNALLLYNCTIANNQAGGFVATQKGGGLFLAGAVTADLHSTIVATNFRGTGGTPDDNFGDVSATVSFFYSLSNEVANLATGTSVESQIGSGFDPILDDLSFNGGPTRTHALLTGSDAIDRGSNAVNLNYDQRGPGYARDVKILTDPTILTTVDVGAYEVQDTVKVVKVEANDQPHQSMVTSFTVTFNQAVTFSGGATGAFTLERVTAIGTHEPTTTGLVNISVAQPSEKVAVMTFLTSGSNPVSAVNAAGSLPDGTYRLTALSSKTSGTYGNGSLDGDGNGSAGGDYVLTGGTDNDLFRLFGDFDGDGDVDAADLGSFRTHFGDPANYDAAFDYDGDGDVDAADFAAFRAHFGNHI